MKILILDENCEKWKYVLLALAYLNQGCEWLEIKRVWKWQEKSEILKSILLCIQRYKKSLKLRKKNWIQILPLFRLEPPQGQGQVTLAEVEQSYDSEYLVGKIMKFDIQSL